MNEKYALYIGNAIDILDIKTANGFYYWRREDCVGEIALPGCAVTTGLAKLSLTEAFAKGARRLLIGITPHGGAIGKVDLPIVIEALGLGFTIVSGLHSKLGEVPEIASHPAFAGGRVIEMREGGLRVVGSGKKRRGKRILTVGTDCCVGKMFTALAIWRGLLKKGVTASFRATGQTGIMIAGEGVCIDAVVADFIAGNIERLTADNETDHWDVIEGQGSLFHPAYAGVSLGLLHGSQPDALVVCHEWGRTIIDGTDSHFVPSLEETIELNLRFARMTNPNARVAGISLNTRRVDETAAKRICADTEATLGLPCVDVLREGAEKIVEQVRYA